MEDEYQSLASGVLVFPFRETDEPEAGPSVIRQPLRRLYDEAYARYEASYHAFEADQIAEQLDDVVEWLEQCDQPPLLATTFPLHRLPLAIIQNASDSLPQLLHKVSRSSISISGRDCPDLNSAMRAIAAGFLGEAVLETKKSGRSGIEEVERWWAAQKDRTPPLIHVDQVLAIPPNALSELLHILSIHRDLPVRLLLSVPSTAHFLSSLTLIDQSAIDITIIQPRRERRNATAMEAVLDQATDAAAGVLRISAELSDEIRRLNKLYGGGSQLALKALKWSLLRHSFASPLQTLAGRSELPDNIVSLLDSETSGTPAYGSLFEVPLYDDLHTVIDPAPRIAIMHALTRPSDFLTTSDSTKVRPALEEGSDHRDAEDQRPADVVSPKRSKRSSAATDVSSPTAKRGKRAHSPVASATSPPGPTPDALAAADDNGPGRDTDATGFRELEMLFGLWRSAGRSINLWDWLEAFRSGMIKPDKNRNNPPGHTGQDVPGSAEESRQDVEDPSAGLGEDAENDDDIDDDDVANEQRAAEAERHQEELARLHAIFIRFCEEARMLGLVRARGKGIGRRADEVVKGVGLI